MSLHLSSESLARMSARHPWRVIAAWAAVLAIAFLIISTLLEDALTTEFGFSNEPESERADKLLEERLRGPKKVSEEVSSKSV